MSIKLGDKVVIIAGKDRKRVGEVIGVDPKENRVTVKGVNIVSKNKKPRKQKEKGGIIKFEAPIDVSNAQVICPKCNAATRVAHAINDKGKKHRACKKCAASLDSGKRIKKQEVKEVEVKTDKKAAQKETVKKAAAKPSVTKQVTEKGTAKPPQKVKNNIKLKKTDASAVRNNVKNKTVSGSGK
jgi:large subunit ribosomal protein L24